MATAARNHPKTRAKRDHREQQIAEALGTHLTSLTQVPADRRR
jgi:hypothetical protein